jgi:hypothetical protein
LTYDGMDGTASSQEVTKCDSLDARGWRKLGAGNPPSWPATTMFLGGRCDIAVMGGGGFIVPW